MAPVPGRSRAPSHARPFSRNHHRGRERLAWLEPPRLCGQAPLPVPWVAKRRSAALERMADASLAAGGRCAPERLCDTKFKARSQNCSAAGAVLSRSRIWQWAAARGSVAPHSLFLPARHYLGQDVMYQRKLAVSSPLAAASSSSSIRSA